MSDFYHDDPVDELDSVRRKPKVLFGSALLLFAGGLFLNTTLAANINLNSGGRVEFGQGTSIVAACSEGSALTVTPQSEFVNATGTGAYYVKSIQVSGIPASCEGKDFNISLFDSVTGSSALPIFVPRFETTQRSVATVHNNAGYFDQGFQGTGTTVSGASGVFTVTFDQPLAFSSNTMNVTLQSTEHKDWAIASISSESNGSHTCAVLSSSAAKCWGSNGSGQVGDNTTTQRETPVAVSVLGSGIRAISAGQNHTCAVLVTGAVKCWGENNVGQLGNGTTANSRIPVDVIGLSSGVTAISAGQQFTCALLRTGAVKCWGKDQDGQLGNGTPLTASSTPVDVTGLSSGVTAIDSGGGHNCALLSTGGVKCWGWGGRGAIGDGSGSSRNTPTNVTGLSSGVIAISNGGGHSCALLRTGAIKCWGFNDNQQAGPVAGTDEYIPRDVPGISSAVSIVSGGSHNCALFITGAAKCWGSNGSGQLGDGTTTQAATPVDVSGLSSAITVSAGNGFTCALLSSGAAKCWGAGGKIGDGTGTQRLTPTSVLGIP